MTPRTEQIIQTYLDGLRTKQEALDALDTEQVRGAFFGQQFLGYDYRHQVWVDTAETREKICGDCGTKYTPRSTSRLETQRCPKCWEAFAQGA